MHSLNLKLRWLKHLLASFLLSPMASDEKPQLQSFIFRQIFEDRLKRAGGTIQPMSCKVLHFIDSELGLRKQTRLPPTTGMSFLGKSGMCCWELPPPSLGNCNHNAPLPAWVVLEGWKSVRLLRTFVTSPRHVCVQVLASKSPS